MKTIGEDYAFAAPESGTEIQTTFEGQNGLTKREYFAAVALQGLLANSEKIYHTLDYSENAVEHADLLINALNNILPHA